MALPTDAQIFGIAAKKGIYDQLNGRFYLENIRLSQFFHFPEPGERNAWPRHYWWGHDGFDDGGGAAVAHYRFGLCSTAS